MFPEKPIRITVLAGAGASCFARMPTVLSFFKHVNWPSGNLLMEICQALAREISRHEEVQEHHTWPEFDAEKIFGWLELAERAGRIRDTNIGMTYSSQSSVQTVLSHLKSEVVRIYGASIPPDVLSEAPHHSLIELIDKVAPSNEPLYFFTTNYDVIIEQTLEAKGPDFLSSGRKLRVCTGFTSTRPNRWQPELFRAKPERGERLVHVVKLHGSATWKKDDSGPVETGWGMPTPHDCLLYFGYKSIPEEEPFIALHELLKTALLESDTVVTIGFRFGDPYIRELFDFSMRANSNLRIICILTKQPEANSPVASMMRHFPGRINLLVDEQGNAVPFGAGRFPGLLEKVLRSPDLAYKVGI